MARVPAPNPVVPETGIQAPLTAQEVVAFLLGQHLLEERAVVEQDLQIEEVSGRNRNFRVVAAGGSGYFLKQAQPDEIGDDRPITVEAELYRRIAADPAFVALRPITVGFRHFDPGASLLVLELATGTTIIDEWDREGSTGESARANARLGTAMAACHFPADAAFLPRSPPWPLDIARPSPAGLRRLAPAQIQVIRAIQAEPVAWAAIDGLRDRWVASTLIHGDFKRNNLLVELSPDGHPTGVKLVDWEMAQLGDPAWDVGAVFHSYLARCVLELQLPDDASAEAAALAFAAGLPPVHLGLRAFWDGYTRATELIGAQAERFADRAAQYCAVRLIQSAFEWSQAESTMPRSAAAILQLGINLLRRPDEARRVVLGR